MKLKWILLIGLLLNSPPVIAKNLYESIVPGLYYRKLELSGGIKLHIFKADLSKIKIDAIDARDFKKKAMNAVEMSQKTQALVVANSNFFSDDLEPLGLVIQAGKIKNPIRPISWWAGFLVHNNQATIRKLAKEEKPNTTQFGLQTGPRLVINGKIPKLKIENSPKTAIGIDRQGYVYLIASEGRIEINELAKVLVTKEGAQGVGLRNALNLDGGSSTQLYHKSAQLEVKVSGLSNVPIGIGFFKK